MGRSEAGRVDGLEPGRLHLGVPDHVVHALRRDLSRRRHLELGDLLLQHDITPFTINYLGDDPADDPAIYEKTSPMSYIKQAKTPTLIQHGELDRRVPIPNAYELRQGLQDRGVPVEMVVYKGFGHGISKPKAMRAVMQHNLLWFNHYLWGDPLPDLAKLEQPK